MLCSARPVFLCCARLLAGISALSLPASPRTFDTAGRGSSTQHLSDRGAAELRTMLSVAKLAALHSDRLTTFADQAETLYASTDHSLLWIRDGKPTTQAREANNRLKHAEEKGLDPDDYSGRFADFGLAPSELPDHPSESQLIRFDVGLTLAAIQYLSDLHLGRANPKSPLLSSKFAERLSIFHLLLRKSL